MDTYQPDFFPDALELPAGLRLEILAHLAASLPEEACGMVGGRITQTAGAAMARASVVLPVENALHSPVRFQMEPVSLLQAILLLEDRGLDLVAIYHSHPAGPAQPSATDIAEFAYPGALTLIGVPQGIGAGGTGEGWGLRAFCIQNHLTRTCGSQADGCTGDCFSEVNIRFVEEPPATNDSPGP